MRALEAIEIEVMQGKPTAGIFVHESEAWTGSLIVTSERSRHALAELGFSRPKWPFEADDRALLEAERKVPDPSASISSGVSHTTPWFEKSCSSSRFRIAIELRI